MDSICNLTTDSQRDLRTYGVFLGHIFFQIAPFCLDHDKNWPEFGGVWGMLETYTNEMGETVVDSNSWLR